jgi:hypothetical protein
MLARFEVIGSSTDRGTEGNGRLVEHVVDARHRSLRNGEVGQVSFDQLHTRQVRQVFTFAGDEAVCDAHALAAPKQLCCDVGPDEAGAAVTR